MSVALTPGRNVLGGPLRACSYDPVTGFFRDGCCRTRGDDMGRHVVCARMTQAFLDFSRSRGNDLSTGLKPGDRWCLCVHRWREAWEAGVAPPVSLEATHEQALEVVTLDMLKSAALESGKPAF
mgnify:FL=1